MVTPCSKRGPASSSPEMNWDDAEASRVTGPPGMRPDPWTVKGRVSRPSSWILAPRVRSESMTWAMGRRRAWGSPSKATGPSARAATGGRNRLTVPASPQSTDVVPDREAGTISQSSQSGSLPGRSLTTAPRERNAATISRVSRERSGRRSREVPLASAARTRYRLVNDLLPGRATVALTGTLAWGDNQSVNVPLSWGLHGVLRAGRGPGLGSGKGVVGLVSDQVRASWARETASLASRLALLAAWRASRLVWAAWWRA